MRAAIVRKWVAACKEFAIRDDMLVKIAERKKLRPIGKGDELWLRLKTAECLTEAEALMTWSQSTWKTYKCALVAMQWGKAWQGGARRGRAGILTQHNNHRSTASGPLAADPRCE